jgi:hypothetical protein
MDAFARQALVSYPDLLIARGNCDAYSGAGDAYSPFRDVMAMLTRDVEARWSAGTISDDTPGACGKRCRSSSRHC